MINESIISKEQFMFELSNWIEIHETQYFSTIFQEGYGEEEFNDLIRYLTYLYNDHETKLTYPKTVYYIPEIIKSIRRIADSQLLLKNLRV